MDLNQTIMVETHTVHHIRYCKRALCASADRCSNNSPDKPVHHIKLFRRLGSNVSTRTGLFYHLSDFMKNLPLCSEDEQKPYGFGKTPVNDDINVHF